ncbi:hypothetical protein SprV_0100349700 [Sparganum proliferum]
MSKFLESQQPNCNSTASDGTSSEDKSGEISFASRTCARSTGASSQPPAKRAKSFFQSVYTNEARFLPPSTEELPTPNVSHILFSEGIVRRELEALNESKSPGPDEIPPKLLKELASELSVPLSMLFQTSFDTGTLPIDWKLAHITPLYKGGSRASTTNYRPISLTCILCKVMERIMKNELIDFLEVHGLLSNCQHGFRKGRSCTTNLLRSLQSWTRALDDRHEVHIAFIDFQKAFDTVPHQRLLHKLKKIGIGGNFLKWIENYLLGRHQVVCIGQGKSDPAMVGSGVPQGSVLGPILFLIYVDDAARALDCEVAMFADDMKIWSVIRGPADEDILQVNLNRLEEWSSRWLLRFNVAGKIFARILLNHLNHHQEQGLLPENQCSFRRHRGTTDIIFVARQLQEKCREMRIHLHPTFVHLTKEFDTVNREDCGKSCRNSAISNDSPGCLMFSATLMDVYCDEHPLSTPTIERPQPVQGVNGRPGHQLDLLDISAPTAAPDGDTRFPPPTPTSSPTPTINTDRAPEPPLKSSYSPCTHRHYTQS